MSQDAPPIKPENLEEQTEALRRLARGLVRDYDSAEDVVQETCLKALTGQVRPRRSVGACLAGTARNIARKLHRGEARRTTRERGSARPEALPSTSEMVQRLEAQRRVLACVHALDEPYRSTTLLRYFEDHSPREIARATGVPLDTVKSRLKRALARLRQRMDAEHGGSRRRWMAVLMPTAGIHPASAASLLTMEAERTGGTVMAQGAGLKISVGILVVLLPAGGALLAGGVFDDVAPLREREEAELLSAEGEGPGLATLRPGAQPMTQDPAAASGPAGHDAFVVTGSGSGEAREPATGALGAEARRAREEAFLKAKPAVRRSPFSLPKRRGTRFGPRSAPGGGMTGHWTKFGPFPRSKGTARLAVSVLDTDGVALPGADVYIGPPDQAGVNGISFGDLRKVGKTDAAGRLFAEALPDGAASVFANSHNRLNGRFGLDGSHGVTTLLVPGTTSSVELKLPFTAGEVGAVQGQVRGPDGTPLRSASVSVGFQQVLRSPTAALRSQACLRAIRNCAYTARATPRRRSTSRSRPGRR